MLDNIDDIYANAVDLGFIYLSYKIQRKCDFFVDFDKEVFEEDLLFLRERFMVGLDLLELSYPEIRNMVKEINSILNEYYYIILKTKVINDTYTYEYVTVRILRYHCINDVGIIVITSVKDDEGKYVTCMVKNYDRIYSNIDDVLDRIKRLRSIYLKKKGGIGDYI